MPTFRAAGFVRRLSEAQIGSTFNFYAEGAGARLRCARLREHLESRCDARILLVGEAAGYRGARVSGLAFTSERQLTGTGPAEASATIVQRALAELGQETFSSGTSSRPIRTVRANRSRTGLRPARKWTKYFPSWRSWRRDEK